MGIGDEDLEHPNYNLVESNRLGFAGVNPGNGGAMNLDLGSPSNIARFTVVYGAMGSGLDFKNTSSRGAGTGGCNNRVYNNTSYHNGFGWDASVYGGMNVTYNGQGIAQYSMGQVATGNVIKNNLVYGNRLGSICQIGFYNNGATACTPAAYDTVVNN
jgi:hypothetical protein